MDNQWKHLSSRNGDLPTPPVDPQQTLCLVLDVDKDGRSDIIIGGRNQTPALVWLRPGQDGWSTYIIDNSEGVRLEAGGAFHDIDGDGYPDIVAGGDHKSNKLYWWKNPGPPYDPQTPWQRYEIKNSGLNKYHDQIFGDFNGDGKPELVFWNQRERLLYISEIPPNPAVDPWPYTAIYHDAGELFPREGLGAADIDGDGQVELLAGGLWFKHTGGTNYIPYPIDEEMRDPRIRTADLNGDGKPEVVMVTSDHKGPIRWYECCGDPTQTESWRTHPVVDFEIDHGHSLEIADFDGDGHLDILCAEMRDWIAGDNPKCKMWIFYGDGKGNFSPREIAEGYGIHEAKIGDFDGDGRPDICAKPFCWDTNRIDVWLNRIPR
jgi:hypothetical protein